jgi:HEAT repeat protein
MSFGPPIRSIAPAALLLLQLAAGCTSFERLRAGDPTVDEQEVFAAGQAGDRGELTDALHDLLDRHEGYSTEVVVAAISALAERGDPASAAHVAPLATHPDEEVRWHVAVALKALGGGEARAVLERMGHDDPSELVREEALSR